eukprot:s97_g11.t1
MNGPHHPDTLRLQRAAELQKSAGNSQEELLKMIGEPAILSGEVVTYKGRILHEDGCECIVSFPGKYAEAWNECARAHQHHTSVACVFLPDQAAGFGLHAADPDAKGKCFCPRLYGARSKEVFGYKDDEAAFLKKSRLPIWGCEWFRQRCKNVEFAVARNQKLDCVLFGRSTIFYVFLQKVSPEELTAKLRSPYDIDKEEWEGGLTQKVVNSILGEARTDDPLERELARVYCNQLQRLSSSSGFFSFLAFPGLHFELASQAPVLSYGFATHGNLPELSVRLVQRIAPLHRFRRAAWKLMAATKGTRIKERILTQRALQTIGCILRTFCLRQEDAVERVLPSSASPAFYDGTPELLSTWTWTKFLSRLEMMHEAGLPCMGGQKPVREGVTLA